MQSRLQDIAKPATKALLKAIDQTTNGNTFLLKVQTDTPLTASNYQDELHHFLRSPLFQEMIIEQDQQRELYNYTWWGPTTENDVEMQHPSGNLVKDHFTLVFTSMDEGQFAKRLCWILREAFSPYDIHMTEKQAQELIRDFFWEVFGPESWPLDDPFAQAYWSAHPWFFSAVQPDFLHSIEEEENEAQEEDIFLFVYFEGGTESDTCTIFYQADILYLFLTSGSA